MLKFIETQFLTLFNNEIYSDKPYLLLDVEIIHTLLSLFFNIIKIILSFNQ